MSKHPWTEEDDDKLLALIEAGIRRYKLPRHFPDRTAASVVNRADKINPEESPETIALSSKALCTAIKALMERMPARKVAEVLGEAPTYIPGTEPVIRGQQAERMLAA